MATNGKVDDILALDTITKAEEGVAMEVRGPGGRVLKHDDGTPFTITLYGKDAQVYVDRARMQADKRAEETSRGRNVVSLFVVSNDDALDLIVTATKTWDIMTAGARVEPTPQNFRKLYKQLPELRRQAEEFVGASENFFRG